MKKIILLLLVTVVFFSCKDEDHPVPTALYFEETSATIVAGGETVSLPFKTTAPELKLTMLTEATWCTVKIEGENLVITAEKNNSITGRETSVKVATSDRDITIPIKQEGQPTVKLTVVSGTASSFHSGEDIDKSFDGDYESIYHSEWGIDESPYTLVYNLSDTSSSLDLISYYPRPGTGLNGIFGKIEIYVSTKENSEFVKIMDYDCGGETVTAANKQPSHIELPGTIVNPLAVKFIVLTGRGGFASCAEMEFYKKAEN